ncbi:RDD family protein [Vibrio sp.]|uniref:RDD domain-containing protein n=1 Tax=Vibrio viridaestus TaxID=2487322 RepID=A0A3N9U3R3_9VIBR|nr:RDD family protein [Vibrio viridaestus]MDC0612563.1 RDD family protein [Vibrio sp.]RQW64222.1 hypothetical protein EES38_06450 [Vibrio viridaestus]
MDFKFKYRRAGTFIIDLAVVKIFAELGSGLYLGVIAYLGKGSGVSVSLTDSVALPVLLAIYVMLLLVFIGVYLGYHWLCLKLLGTSLSRYLLGVKVVSDKGAPLSHSAYLKREFDKVVWCIATLGIYALYSAAQYMTFSHPPLHDKKNHTQVVES